ncbi:hypothetical protein PVL29_016005 [Vitis rotundifolia]|uniref:Uncharacterized protein n=1 Tax=Vitis rotundifolia TaxID=103349 RepID=A0AA39DK70_VITRO|nr:hypothetical protein PVL29_016005 [Vitis rotundifolia]
MKKGRTCLRRNRIHFFNFNTHDKDLSSFPVKRPTWAYIQDTEWDCRIHFVSHIQRLKYMESNSILFHEESTLTMYKLVIELMFDNENSEKVIILNKIHIHAKTNKQTNKRRKYRIQSRVDFFIYMMSKCSN